MIFKTILAESKGNVPDVLEAAIASVALPESPGFVGPLFSSLETLNDLNLADDLIDCIKGASSSSSSPCLSSSSRASSSDALIESSSLEL